MFQFAGFDTVGLGKIGLGIDGPVRASPATSFVTHEYGIEYGHFVEGELVLVQYGYAFTRGDIHLPYCMMSPLMIFKTVDFTGPAGADDTVTATPW